MPRSAILRSPPAREGSTVPMPPDDGADERLDLPPAPLPRAGDHLRFLIGFLRRPMSVASVVPSSRWLTRRVAAAAVRDGTRTVVELGPGTGVVTRSLLDVLPRDGRLLALELEPDFADRLAEEPDPRLAVHAGDAQALREIVAEYRWSRVDAVVSGIPFSTLGPERGAAVLRAAWDVLAPGGRFVAYQFRPHVDRFATPLFGPPDVTFEPRNVPPMSVYCWHKPAH
jgi:phosphatidylethanolamine/phosphatidyl-N-methylethanolamine N-methyltransferase